MAKREPIKLGAREFASKKAAMEHVKSCLNWYRPEPGEEIDLPPEGVAVMLDVFRRHPDFDRKFPHGLDGVERIFIKRDEAHGGRTSQFWYQYDGEMHDISYVKCFGAKDSYQRNGVVAAFRKAIASQILAFKHGSMNGVDEGRCAITGRFFPEEELAVDHAEPFSSLLARFMKERKLKFSDVKVVHVSGDGMFGTRLADENLEKLWTDWHRTEAKLQLVNAKLNNRLKNKDKNSLEARKVVEDFLKTA